MSDRERMGSPESETAHEVAESIGRMAETLKRLREPGEGPVQAGWWVLAVGGTYGGLLFDQRDKARERLRLEVADAGIRLVEHTWVWDKENRVQLVVATLPTKERAERVAERLRAKRLVVRVVRERF